MKEGIVDGLRKLGLTEYEAKAYATLVGMGEATAREVHELCGVPRTRIYDILRDLDGKGLRGVCAGLAHLLPGRGTGSGHGKAAR